MSGWPSVTIIILAQVAVAGFLLRIAARRWWDYLAVSTLTVLLIRPTAHYITGDVSTYLPGAVWSDGFEGKDQIIDASVASTILLPLIVSAVAVYLVRRAWRASQSTRERDAR